MKNYYPHLFQPIRMRDVIFPNRVFVSSMGFPPTHKHPSSPKYDAGVSFYDKSAGGGAAILVTTPPVMADGQYNKYDRDMIREQMSLAGQSGSKVGAGLGVFGVDLEHQIEYGPSTYRKPNGMERQEISEEMMMKFLQDLRVQARAARLFGFDYVQFHMAHESLLSHFMAPGFNKRTDEYGGSLENRMHYPLMCIRALREEMGPKMPLIVRLSAYLHCEESFEFEEMLEFIKRIQGEADMINVSCGMDTWYETNVFHCTTPFQPHGINVHWAARIKEACPGLFVCPVGGIVTPEQAEEIIAAGQADAVMLGRAMNADPFWPKKAREGRGEDIVPCLRCSYCYHAANDHNLIACSVNPRFFRENRVPLKPEKADILKKVVIVGGGPAGCMAALTAANRGHDVTLIEKTDRVGGQIKHAVYDEYKSDLDRYRRYLQIQIEKSKVKVLYNRTATPEMIREMEPDALIIALGAEPVKLKIPGSDKALVRDCVDSYYHLEEIGQKVVIIGGGTIGCEMGLKLAEDGHDVEIVEATDTLSGNGHMLYRIGIRKQMDKVKDRLCCYTKALCQEITDDSVLVKMEDGMVKTLKADTVLIAVGLCSKKDEAFSFYGITPETYTIGDCDRVGKVLEAVNHAYFIAANM